MSIEYKDINEWEVETATGWQSFCGIKKIKKKKYIVLKFASGKTLICSENHKVKRVDGIFVPSTRLKKGTKIFGKNKIEVVILKEKIAGDIDLYDLIEVENGHEYFTNELVSSNCAFIDGIEEIWLSAQYTLSTGGKAIVLSTPNGVGNFFHKMWTESEQGLNDMNRISLPWHMHPERDQKWRDEQTKLSGEKGAAQECFGGDTRIYTSRGLVPISNIIEGDLVLTHVGTFNSVIKIMSNVTTDVRSVYSSLNQKKIISTNNHPYYTRDKKWVELKNIQNNSTICSFPRFIDAGIYEKKVIFDLTKIVKPTFFKLLTCNNDKLIFINDRRHKTVHNRFIDIDEDFGFLMGIYLAEGWVEDNRTYFCFNWETEKNDWPVRIESILNKKFGINTISYRKCGNNSGQLMVSSQILSKTLRHFSKGITCYDKCLSQSAFESFNISSWIGFCDGAFVGDGMVLKKYSKVFTSRSENFAYDVKFALHITGHNLVSYSIGNTNKEDAHIIKVIGTSEIVCDHRMISRMEKPTEYRTKSIQGLDIEYQYSTIQHDVLNTIPIQVYNLEVQGNHSYVTEHFVVHNCDCEFSTSGNTVIDIPVLDWYTKTHVIEPIEKRGFDKQYYIFKYPEPGRSYMVVADVARGDASDFSACHIIDIETIEQVAEYKGKLSTKDYARLLMTLATEYNMALLVIENANVGWAVIQDVIDANYDNLFYSSADLQYIDVETQMTNKIHAQESKMTPGFTTSNKSRPLLISKLESYIRNKEAIIHSKRLIEELSVFIWKSTGSASAKAEAMDGYNDDLVMAFAIAMWIRDVALRLRKEADSVTRSIISKIGSTSNEQIKNNMVALHKSATNPYGVYSNPWKMNIGGPGGTGKSEDITWLL